MTYVMSLCANSNYRPPADEDQSKNDNSLIARVEAPRDWGWNGI
jgi:hypothetical protein